MIVVADSTILIRLGRVQRLDLLQSLYSEIVVPQRVWDEVVVDGSQHADALELEKAHAAGWVKVLAPSDPVYVSSLLTAHHGLDRGEAEAMIVASEIAAQLILIDEETGYTVAKKAYGGVRRVAAFPHVLDECIRANILTPTEANTITTRSRYAIAKSVRFDFKQRRDQRPARPI
jgi:predicted nucleic acid-binding protein